MAPSLEQFLEQTATRGTWYGGGSASAFTCALAAALLQKLVTRAALSRQLNAIRHRCLALVEQDAEAFAAAIRTLARRPAGFPAALRLATEVPAAVYAASQRIRAIAKTAQREVRSKYQVDLRCAVALARASAESSRGLIRTNLAWLKDPRYSRQLRQRLKLR